MSEGYKPLTFDWEYRPTWGNFKHLYETFGCPITVLAERMAGERQGEPPTAVECLAFFEKVSGKPYTAELKNTDVFLTGDYMAMLTKLKDCILAHHQLPEEYTELVKDDPTPPGGSKKKSSG